MIDGEQVKLDHDKYQEDQYGHILVYVWENCITSLRCQNDKWMVNWVLIKKKKKSKKSMN